LLQHTIVSVCEYEDHKYNAFKIYILSFTFCLCIGPESLLRRPAMVTQEPDSDSYYHYLREDIVEKEDWRCFHTVNGLRIFEDVTASKVLFTGKVVYFSKKILPLGSKFSTGGRQTILSIL
jgi:hypothetical protein